MLEGFPQTLLRYRVWVGLLAISICAVTWAADMAEWVYACPYCRSQRSVIGLLGLLLTLPNFRHWLVRYIASVLAFFGAAVAATQHFSGWRAIMAGEFEIGAQWFVNPWLLSGCALCIILGLLLLIWAPATLAKRANSPE